MRILFARCVLVLVLAFVSSIVSAAVPDCVSALVREMRETGSSVRGGVSPELGVYVVGIGQATYLANNVNMCREIAQVNAVKEIAAALQTTFKAKDVVALQMTQDADSTDVSAFVGSLTESSIDSMVKGVQVASAEQAGEQMLVAVYLTSKAVDRMSELTSEIAKRGDAGTVMAVGIDVDRSAAEKNALRSAVEQVAGTIVVGKVSVNEREEMHKRLATTAGALVEEYRVVSEKKIDVQFRVEILARVNKRKLYDSYRSYFKCLDNPVFCIVATDRALIRHFAQFFADKGFSLVNDPAECQYLIKLDGRFRDRPTPGNDKSTGTMLNLGIEIVSVDGKITLLIMNERQAKDSEVLTADQRHEEVARRIFNKLEVRLHKAIQDMVVRMLDEADAQADQELEVGTEF